MYLHTLEHVLWFSDRLVLHSPAGILALTPSINRQSRFVSVRNWTSFYLLHGLWGWEERELIKRSSQFSLPPSLYLFIFGTWKLSELLIIPRVHFLFFFPSRKAADLSRWGSGQMSCWETKGISRDDHRDKGSSGDSRGWGGEGDWVQRGWGRRVQGASRNRHKEWSSRGHGGEICLSAWNVLSLSAVQGICGIASCLAGLMPVETLVCVRY